MFKDGKQVFSVGDIVEITDEAYAAVMLDFVKGKGYPVIESSREASSGRNGTIYIEQVKLKDESGRVDWYGSGLFKLKEKEEKKVETLFKVGDIVEITEESDATGMLDFKKGKGYPVANVAGGMVRILNESGRDGWYSGGHFKLKEDLKEGSVPEFNVGDIVICIEKDFYELDVNDITYLKEYIVKHSNKGCIQIVKDSGALGWFSSGKFKLKEDTKVEKKECLFKKGQVVWDLRNGRGVVESVNFKDVYPVKVKFDLKDMDGYAVTDRYTLDGRFVTTQTIRSLYFSEPKIEAATEPVFEPVLKRGDVVAMVSKSSPSSNKYIITVAKEQEDGVVNNCGTWYGKCSWDFYHLGEKIVFN